MEKIQGKLLKTSIGVHNFIMFIIVQTLSSKIESILNYLELIRSMLSSSDVCRRQILTHEDGIPALKELKYF